MKVEKLFDKYQQLAEKFSHMLNENTGIDGSTNVALKKAKEVMQVPYEALREVLPYECYDSENELFINRQSIGFSYSVLPLTGADEGTVRSLASLLKNKLPAGWDCQGVLFKHSMIADKIKDLYGVFLAKGGMYATIAEMAIKYHVQASKKGYKNKRGYPCRLSDYRVYLFFSRAKRSFDDLSEELLIRESIESELKVCKFIFKRLDDIEFATYLRAIISYVDDQESFDIADVNPMLPLGHSIPKRGTTLTVDDRAIHGTVYDSQGKKTQSEIVSLTVKKWPDFYALWSSSENYASIKEPEQGIQSTFLLSFNIRALHHESQKMVESRKARSLRSRNNHIYRQLNPGIEHEAEDHDFVHKNMVQDNLTLCDVSLNLILLSTPNNVRNDMAKAISAFNNNKIELEPAYGTQWLSFLSSLPFFMSEGLYHPLKSMDQVMPLTNWNAANFLPVVGEFQGCGKGVILPTLRNQLCAIDFHDTKNLPITNMNHSVLAGSGAGKSYQTNNEVSYELANGNQVFIIDVGDSFKHLTSLYNGVYIEYQNLKLNPFTLFDFEGKSIIKSDDGELIEVDSSEQIKDLLALMASPDKSLEPVQQAYLTKAVRNSWIKYKQNACIDNVIEELEVLLNSKYQNDVRLKDLILLLDDYTSSGTYGDIFSGQTTNFNDDQLVVLELGGLEHSNPKLLRIVLYALIIVIQGQFYHGERDRNKRCIIDEAWQFLGQGSNPIAASFIEKGFRTARKYNGGFTVIGQKLDELKNSDTGRAIEACCDIQIIMRQSNIEAYLERHPKEFNKFQTDMIKKFGAAKDNGFSEMMLKFGGNVSFHRLFSDPFSRILYSTDGDEFQKVENLVKQGHHISDAVQVVANKYYGDEL